MDKNFDFSGWATKANLLCSDGRIIRENAFEECDGKKVPLIWNHQHGDPNAVLGHALLENRGDGVYAYCTFNDTDAGQNAKLLVRHGDVDQLSIYANKLVHKGRDVIHGVIREVSLVLAGANSGARIDSVVMHSDDSYEEGYIYTGENIDNVDPLIHADNGQKGEPEMAGETKKPSNDMGEETIADVMDTLTEKQKKAVYAVIGMAVADATGEEPDDEYEDDYEDDMQHSDEDKPTVEDVLDSLTEEQQDVVFGLIGQALEEVGYDDDEEEYDEEEYDEDDEDDEYDEEFEGGNDDMKHNVFDQDQEMGDVLTHSEMVEIIEDAKRNGSMKDAVLQHGIEFIDYLMPDAKTMNNVPEFIKRDDTWVGIIMNGVHKSPFARIKSIFADITEADARAKGYVKGNMKVEELFTLLKRTTTPTTIYKKQKIDRDDMVDITDFDVVAWLKTEMRMMLDEEIARAVLVGDGRSSSSNDKINEQNVRPIWTDDDIYTVKVGVNVTSSTTDDEKARSFIKSCIKSRKEYKGSGNPIMFISEDMLTNCLLLEDTNKRVIYDSMDKLATALRVSRIVSVPVMENLTRTVGSNTHTLAGIYVNLADYNVGADKGGAINMFDDFDIDYNQQKYLIETRCSGALTKPYSAVAIEFVQPTA